MTITWKIEQMSVKPQEGSLSDVVVTAAWRCNGQDGDYSATNYGTVSFPMPSGDFIAYSDLTEADVLGWAWADGVDKDAVEANVTRELNDKINPPVVTKPLPWSS